MKWTLMTPFWQIEFDDEDLLPKMKGYTPEQLLTIPADHVEHSGTIHYDGKKKPFPMVLIPEDNDKRSQVWWDNLKVKLYNQYHSTPQEAG